MYGYDPSLPIHFYIDASSFAAGLAITQFRTGEDRSQVEVPIVYDSFNFISS